MADNKDPKKPEDSSADKGAKKKKLIIIGGAALLLLIILGVAAFFLLKKEPEKTDKHEETAEVHAPELHPPATIGPMIEIKEFVVNIISEEERHYVKASITIELVSSAGAGHKAESGGGHGGGDAAVDPAKDEATKRMPQIRDSILLLISNKTYEELIDLQGKKQLKAELASKINSILQNGKVKEIYFTDFVVQ